MEITGNHYGSLADICRLKASFGFLQKQTCPEIELSLKLHITKLHIFLFYCSEVEVIKLCIVMQWPLMHTVFEVAAIISIPGLWAARSNYYAQEIRLQGMCEEIVNAHNSNDPNRKEPTAAAELNIYLHDQLKRSTGSLERNKSSLSERACLPLCLLY